MFNGNSNLKLAGVTVLLVQHLSCCGFLTRVFQRPPPPRPPTVSEAVEIAPHGTLRAAHGFGYNRAAVFSDMQRSWLLAVKS